jgi:hypothetical protein
VPKAKDVFLFREFLESSGCRSFTKKIPEGSIRSEALTASSWNLVPQVKMDDWKHTCMKKTNYIQKWPLLQAERQSSHG